MQLNKMQKYEFSKEIKTSIKNISKSNNYSCIIALTSDYAIIFIAVYFSELSYYLYPLSALLIGSRQRALATILHEAAHKTLCRNRIANKIIGTYLSGYFVFQTWEAYIKSHVFNHHAKLGCIDNDPDYLYYRQAGVFDTQSNSDFFRKYLIKPLFFGGAISSLRYIIVNRLLRMKSKREIIGLICSNFLLAFAFTHFIGWYAYLVYWLLPYLTFFQVITWFIELSEHYPMVHTERFDIYASRNRFPNFFESFFTGMHNENFHLIHHLFPGVPFYKMKKAHQILLKDSVYARINANFGGIFTSSNFTQSMWESIFMERKVLN